ncbi:MAG: Gfo/Idh/MocA family protein, partial [Bryobacteraceae bacterium]
NTPMKADRRAFLLGAAAALPLQAQEREIRAASIGVGNRGAGLLRQVLARQNVRVGAICDIDAQKRDAAQSLAQRDNPKSYSEWRQVIDLKDVEAVIVATPCDLHAEMAAACLEAGKYVYCEKPLGITPEQVANVLRAARRSKVFLQIGQQLRYYPTMREAIRQLHQGNILGQLFVIKAQRHSTPARPDANRAPRPGWYDDVKRSGDLIVENAMHNIDVCNWVARSRPVSAYGHGKKYLPTPIPAGTVMMDGFSVEYIYENDMHLDYSQLYLHPRGMKELANSQWYIVFGEKGSVELNKGLHYEMQADGPPREMFTPELRKTQENAMADFFACIRENRKPFADITVGATAALTAIMGREAIYRRRMVTWKELGVEV